MLSAYNGVGMIIFMITTTQIRMAKAALKWSNPFLADRCGLHKNTINKAENGHARPATLALLKFTFENEGIEFIENGVLFSPKEDSEI